VYGVYGGAYGGVVSVLVKYNKLISNDCGKLCPGIYYCPLLIFAYQALFYNKSDPLII
jgi:hypothetical protein